MAILIGMSGDVKGKSFVIEHEDVTIGRKSENTIRLNSAAVSGRHCMIAFDGRHYVLKDLDSTNGTRLNSQPVTEAPLNPKDLVQVGTVEFMFDAEPGEKISSTSSISETKVIVTSEPRISFSQSAAASQFTARKRETRTGFYVLVGLVAIVAIALVAILFVMLKDAGP